jgi:hypothetical protein
MSLANNLTEILEIDDSQVPVEDTYLPVTIETEKEIATVANTGNELVDDLDFARTNIRQLIITGTKSLEELKAIAQSSEHPRAYEVFSTLLNSVVAMNKDLVDLHKKKKELLKEEPTQQNGTTTMKVNQAVFVGSTAELSSLIRREKEAAEPEQQ